MGKTKLNLPEKKITEFCKKNSIVKLSLFGSVLREDFRIDSDGCNSTSLQSSSSQ
jgi:hypothetical protein